MPGAARRPEPCSYRMVQVTHLFRELCGLVRRETDTDIDIPEFVDFNPDFPSFSGPPFQKDYDPVDSDDEEPVEWHGFKKSRKASRAPAQSSGSSQPRNKTCRNNSRQAADPEIIRVGQSTTNASQQRLASTGAAIDRIARSSSARASEDNSHNQQRGTKRRADDEEERDEPAPKRAKGGANPGTDRGGNEVHPLATNTQKKNSQLRTTGGGKSPKRD